MNRYISSAITSLKHKIMGIFIPTTYKLWRKQRSTVRVRDFLCENGSHFLRCRSFLKLGKHSTQHQVSCGCTLKSSFMYIVKHANWLCCGHLRQNLRDIPSTPVSFRWRECACCLFFHFAVVQTERMDSDSMSITMIIVTLIWNKVRKKHLQLTYH